MIQPSTQSHSIEGPSGRDDYDLATAITALHTHGPSLICRLWARIDHLERRVSCQAPQAKSSKSLAKQLVDALKESV